MDESLAYAPSPRSPFVGRQRALEWVLECLHEPGACVTLTGPGGVGKTRLALRVAEQASGEIEEVGWVACRDIRTPEELVRRVGQALNLSADQYDSLEEATDGIGAELDGSADLLVCDNLEQTARATRRVLEEWREQTSKVRWLSTARVALDLDGEQTYDLSPLGLERATELFVERAERAGAEPERFDDRDVRRLVDQIDRLPLAVELAAAQARILPPSQMLERLDAPLETLQPAPEGPGSQPEALRRSIARSWKQLDPAHRLALAQMTVFENGATLEAAEAVLSLDAVDPAAPVAQILETLDRRSLLRRRHGPAPPLDRLVPYMPVVALATARRDQLVDVERLRARYADYYVGLSEQMLDDFCSADRDVDLDRMGPEIENLLATYEWTCEHRPEQAAVVAEALGRYDLYRPSSLERQQLFEQVYDVLPDSDEPTVPTVRMEFRLFDERMRNRDGVSDELLARLEELARRAERCRDTTTALGARDRIGWIYRMREQFEQALEVYEDAVELAAEMDDPRGRALALQDMAFMQSRLGRPESAREAFRRAEGEAEHLWSSRNADKLYLNWAELELGDGYPGRAGDVLARGFRQAERDEPTFLDAYAASLRALVDLLEGDRQAAREEARWATEQARDQGNAWKVPLLLIRRAAVYLGCDQPDRAGELLGEAEREARRNETDKYCISAGALQAIAAARRGQLERARSKTKRVREMADEHPMRPVAEAELHLTEARQTLDDDVLESGDALARAARWGTVDQQADQPFYEGDEQAVVASRLFAERLEEFRREYRRAVRQRERFLVVDTHRARWFQADGGKIADLTGRDAMCRLLRGLVDRRLDGDTRRMDMTDMLACGWPEADPESAPRSRVYKAVSRLREMGLEEILCKDADGYYLAPTCPILLREECPR